MLCLATGEALGREPTELLPAACSLELVHTFSLVHDDLPALDDDDLRRGQPSAHVRFGEDVAILAGDALLAEAFRLALRYPSPAVARELADATLGMIGGQYLDITIDGGLDADGLGALHALKTGRLLARLRRRRRLAVAGLPAAEQAPWRAFGDELGCSSRSSTTSSTRRARPRSSGRRPGKDEAAGQGHVRLAARAGAGARARRRGRGARQGAARAPARRHDRARRARRDDPRPPSLSASPPAHPTGRIADRPAGARLGRPASSPRLGGAVRAVRGGLSRGRAARHRLDRLGALAGARSRRQGSRTRSRRFRACAAWRSGPAPATLLLPQSALRGAARLAPRHPAGRALPPGGRRGRPARARRLPRARARLPGAVLESLRGDPRYGGALDGRGRGAKPRADLRPGTGSRSRSCTESRRSGTAAGTAARRRRRPVRGPVSPWPSARTRSTCLRGPPRSARPTRTRRELRRGSRRRHGRTIDDEDRPA